ncbi:MAG: hypothetical protein DI586_10735 [Micavibrio aeruginosavorus]|uniref:ABC transporter ATP-binding protein n=1 Tax=Micavibrio aeruginosavorus TaxID=349221 RepID=A0A2W5FE82_9BACT|nr:MAG: hypothetical protein DI586_10735 [Micavibrio aeruginosavorus]
MLFLLLSVTEVLGIASILPFISVLANPSSVQSNEWLRKGYDFLGFTNTNHFLFLIGIGVFFILIIGNLIKAITRWSTLRATQEWGENLGKRLFNIYLQQPYNFYLYRNSSDLSKNILAEVHGITSSVIMISLDLITKLIVSLVILLFLAIMDPLLALITGSILGGTYSIVFVFFKKSLKQQAHMRSQSFADKYKIVNEAIQGIKNIKLVGYEKLYGEYFSKPAKDYASSTAKSNLIGEIPRYAMEVIGFGGILLMLLYMLLNSEKGLTQALPVIAVYVFAGYRLMPNLQSIYYGVTKLRFNKPILDTIHQEMKYAQSMQPSIDSTVIAIPFSKAIRAENISFKYDQSREIIKNANFEIQAHSMVGIIGKTGAGKTTLVDLILGLLSSTSGKILVDDIELIPSNIHAWQKNLSYVSQHIYLCDDSISANIAFGVPREEVDMDKLKHAAAQASLSQFIEDELEQGYNTIVGENGIRLSGGQRQRIGLARALYLNRPVLVLDEATSALDPHTEDDVMTSIHKLNEKKTILIISHKMDLLSKCDSILLVQDGIITVQNKATLYSNLKSIQPEGIPHV